MLVLFSFLLNLDDNLFTSPPVCVCVGGGSALMRLWWQKFRN